MIDRLDQAVQVLIERRNYLTQRIAAKSHETVGWDVEYDTRERDALTLVISYVHSQHPVITIQSDGTVK